MAPGADVEPEATETGLVLLRDDALDHDLVDRRLTQGEALLLAHSHHGRSSQLYGATA